MNELHTDRKIKASRSSKEGPARQLCLQAGFLHAGTLNFKPLPEEHEVREDFGLERTDHMRRSLPEFNKKIALGCLGFGFEI